MIKVGLIIDKGHLKHKIADFIIYLNQIAEVKIYLEQTYFLDPHKIKFDEDIIFVKGKGELLLNIVRFIEKDFPSIPIINSSKGIRFAINRIMNCMLLRKAGIKVPNFALNPSDAPPPFEDYIIKNIIDEKTYAFKPNIEKINHHLHIKDERALKESSGGKESYHYLFYQEFIKSKWEYKIYGIGDQLYFYKQLPVLVNPNKMQSRRKIDPIPELENIVRKAMKTIDLKLTSVDFLKSKEGVYYLTDINSSPNFNYIENGPKIMGDFLIEQAKK